MLSTFLTGLGEIRYRGSPHEFHENHCHEIHTLLKNMKFCPDFLHLLPYLGKNQYVHKTLPSGCQNRTLLRGVNEIMFILSTLNIMLLSI